MTFPFLGFGVGLRKDHYNYILENRPPIDWFEAISENFMVPGGRPLFILDQVRKNYPVVLHGVSLSIGSHDPLNTDYLKKLKQLIERVEPPWVSDHLCWTGIGGHNVHDLLPLPYTEEALVHVVNKVRQVQDFLKRPILLENVSSYMEFNHSTLPEWEFLAEISNQSGCYILLDINNIYVSSFNHHFNPDIYLQAIPTDRVVQFHLAGHSTYPTYLLDTHDHVVCPEVWDLYTKAVARFDSISTLIEWDDKIPSFSELVSETKRARTIYGNCRKMAS